MNRINLILKNKLNKKSKINVLKFTVAFLVIVSLSMLFLNKVYANTTPTGPSAEDVINILDRTLGTIVNFLVTVTKLIVLLVITILDLLIPEMTIDKILFNELSLINLKFLSTEIGKGMGFDNIVNLFASGSRLFLLGVIAVQFVILIIIAIKGLLNATSGAGIAETKKSLITWAKSMFVSIVITIAGFFIIFANQMIVEGLKSAINTSALNGARGIDGMLKKTAWTNWDIKGNIAFLLFFGIRFQAWALYIYYLRRVLKVLYMLLMGPMVSITMALSSVGAAKSGLSKWLKEFMGTVFIQPVHIIIYLALVVTLLSSADSFQKGLTPGVTDLIPYAILILGALKFIFKAEKFFDKYFTLTSGAEGMGVSTAILGGTIIARGRKYLEKGAKIADKAKEVSTNVNFKKYQVGAKKKDSGSDSKVHISTKPVDESKKKLGFNSDEKAKFNIKKEKVNSKMNNVLENAKTKFNNVSLPIVEKMSKTKTYKLVSAFRNTKSQAVLDQKKNDKAAKKIFRKHNPLKKKALKGIAKKAGYGLAFVAQNSISDNIIGPRTSIALTNAGAKNAAKIGKGIKNSKMFKKGYIPKFAAKISKNGISFKEKREENAELATERFAKEQIRLANKVSRLSGEENIDLHTDKGMEQLDYRNRYILDRQLSGELNKEFEEARSAFENEIQKMYGLTFAQTKEATDEFIREIEKGKDYNYDELTSVQNRFALVLAEMEQAQTILAFNDIIDVASGVDPNSKEYKVPKLDLPDYLEDDKYNDSPNRKLRHYNEVQNYTPYVLDEVKQELKEGESEKEELKQLIENIANETKKFK